DGSVMFDREPDAEYLRRVFEETRVLRRPIAGIVSGYHVLPYVLVGPEEARPQRAVEIRGRIKVSPRLILTPRHLGQTYGELFDDPELMNRALVGRVFSFLYAKRQNVNVESEELRITRVERDPHAQVERALDELTMREVLDTGVIFSPDVAFYPVSIEKFITEILDREFHQP
ncbi:MAG: hypothetical protein ACE147_19340, partial [Candidatus Methylomirabilales bacterium]